jgi:aminopeptidase YwaD
VLAWAQRGTPDDAPVEVVLFNGEDHFDQCGEIAWLEQNELSDVSLAINLDGAGVVGRMTSLAVLGGAPGLQQAVDGFIRARPGWEPAPPWFESDHAIFAMRDVPALAVRSAGVHDLLGDVAHTDRDTLQMVDVSVLRDLAATLDDLVRLRNAG